MFIFLIQSTSEHVLQQTLTAMEELEGSLKNIMDLEEESRERERIVNVCARVCCPAVGEAWGKVSENNLENLGHKATLFP